MSRGFRGVTIPMNADEILAVIKIPALPPGVHFLSPESEAVLDRAAEKAANAEARHLKRDPE